MQTPVRALAALMLSVLSGSLLAIPEGPEPNTPA